MKDEGQKKVAEPAAGYSAAPEPEDAALAAEWLFMAYFRDLQKHHDALEGRAFGDVDPAEVRKARDLARTVRQAAQDLFAERNKIDKLRKEIAGTAGGGQPDLDAARAEIGRRLACLRGAGTG